jgi:hypothetical protein
MTAKQPKNPVGSYSIATLATIAPAAPASPVIVTAPGWPTASTTSTAAWPVTLLGFLRRPSFQDGLARKTDFPLGIDVSHHDGDFITQADDVFNLFYPLGIQLGYMHHSIYIR